MHAYITYVADRAASREVETLADFYGLGTLVVSGEVNYDQGRDALVAAFTERGLKGSTAKVYMSQGYALAQLFDTFDAVEEFADDECNGSRSLKRIYDQTRVKDDAADEVKGEGEGDAEVAATKALIDVVLAGLANLKDAGEIARVRDAAIAMLKVSAAA